LNLFDFLWELFYKIIDVHNLVIGN